MEIERTHIVRSLTGRDRGRVFLVWDTEGDFLLLVDGKTRGVEAPKKKRRKHAQLLDALNTPLKDKLLRGDQVFNSEIRKALSPYAESADTSIGGSLLGER